MAELIDLKELEERVILIAVSTSDEDDTRQSLDELEELADTAGAVTVDKIIQDSSGNLSGQRKNRRGQGARL